MTMPQSRGHVGNSTKQHSLARFFSAGRRNGKLAEIGMEQQQKLERDSKRLESGRNAQQSRDFYVEKLPSRELTWQDYMCSDDSIVNTATCDRKDNTEETDPVLSSIGKNIVANTISETSDISGCLENKFGICADDATLTCSQSVLSAQSVLTAEERAQYVFKGEPMVSSMSNVIEHTNNPIQTESLSLSSCHSLDIALFSSLSTITNDGTDTTGENQSDNVTSSSVDHVTALLGGSGTGIRMWKPQSPEIIHKPTILPKATPSYYKPTLCSTRRSGVLRAYEKRT